MIRCKKCVFFKREEWHPAINKGKVGEKQLGGHCKVLFEALLMTNSKLCWMDQLHVQETFGCSLGKEK